MYTRLQTMAKLRVLFEAGPMVDKHKTGVGYFVDYNGSDRKSVV